MTFLSFGFLFAALAAAIPIVLHMIHRQALKELPFPSLRFLKISEQKTRRKRRIQDILLMILRAAILVLIAFGLANPVISNLSNLWGGSQASVIIILDNSASMGAIDGSATRMDTAILSVERILDEMEETGGSCGLIVTCGETFPENGQLFSKQERIREILAQVKVTYEKADLTSALHRARQTLLKTDSPSKMIFVVSDQQKISWAGLANETRKGDEIGTEKSPNTDIATASNESRDDVMKMRNIPVVFIDCTAIPKPNVGITALDLKNVIPIAQVPVPVGARLRNESTISQKRRLEVLINGNRHYTSPDIDIEPESETRHDFTVMFSSSGVHRCEVRLVGSDGSKYDDRYFFAMNVNQGIPVMLVKPMEHEIAFLEETFYLERALSTGAGGVSPIRLSTLSKEELLNEPLTGYAVVILANIPAPDPETAQKLLDYLDRGGNLIWTVGDNVYADAYNEMNDSLGGRLLPCPIFDYETPDLEDERDSWSIGFLDQEFPAFSNLVQPPALYRSVLVYRHVPFDVEPSFPALANLDDGSPLIVQKKSGTGTSVLFGTGMHVSWTNLPIRPIFVPMINQLVFQLSGIEQTRLQTVSGVPLQLRFKKDEVPDMVEITPPGSGLIQLPVKKTGAEEETFVFAETQQIGIYTLRPIGGVSSEAIPFSVNLDGDEVDPVLITESEIKEKLTFTPVVFSKAGEQIESTFRDLKQGTSLWDMFLLFVLIVLVVEAFVSNKVSQMKSERQDGIDVRKTLPQKTPGLSV